MDETDKTAQQVAAEAEEIAQDAADKAKKVAADAKRLAAEALEVGRAYAKEALDAASKKIDGVKSQVGHGRETLTKSINDEPVKAVMVAAALSSALTAVLVAALRGNRR